MAARQKTAKKRAPLRFIESMECLPVSTLPQGEEWSYEIKLDGFRLEAVKKNRRVTLYSRRGNILNRKFPFIASALEELPDNTILDGEIVALDEGGRSDFALLQNFRSAESKILYYVFDILALKGRDLSQRALQERREILRKVLPRHPHIDSSAAEVGSCKKLLSFVKQQRLEGVVAKRLDGAYEPGRRSGSWRKYRLNVGQEFVVGGYTPGGSGFDALIIGFYQARQLLFAARVRAGFVPATRREVFAKIKDLKIAKCPFQNLPEEAQGRWGQGLTAAKMRSCRWVDPKVVVRIDFAQWTGAQKLRHTKFIGLREDKDARKVVRET